MILPFVNDHRLTANKRKMLEIYNNYPLYNLVPANFTKWVCKTKEKNTVKYGEIFY